MTADVVQDALVAVTGRYRLVGVEETPGSGVSVCLQESKTGELIHIPAEELARNKELLYGMLPETSHLAAHVAGVLTGKAQLFPLVHRLETLLIRHSGRLRFVVIGSFCLGIIAGIALLEYLAHS